MQEFLDILEQLWVVGLGAAFCVFASLNGIRIQRENKRTWFDDMFKVGMLRYQLIWFKESKSIIWKIFMSIAIIMMGFAYILFYLGLTTFIISIFVTIIRH